MAEGAPSIDGQSLVIANEAEPGQGEDSYAAETDALGGLLCVADGCGGIGARRYEKRERHTEAYEAARLTVACVRAWMSVLDGNGLPQNAAEAAISAAALQAELTRTLAAFHSEYRADAASRIVLRGLHRTLPSTLCAALVDARTPESLSCVFFWAGDSRGYLLDRSGLRQCTADHVAGGADALDNLYRDARLTNMVCEDGRFTLETYGLTVRKPCVVLTATDGAFAYLPTPMEFELLLLETLAAAPTLASWQARLNRALGRIASDDSTLALAGFGFHTFDALKAYFAPRLCELKTHFVTPVRHRRQSVDFARGLWAEYRLGYELKEEVRHADWRL